MQTKEYDSEYRASIQPREFHARLRDKSPGRRSMEVGGRSLKITTEMGSNFTTGLTPAMSANAASALMESREREKKEMQDLNERLGSYIEKVRFLEAQNRKLAADLEGMRGTWGKDTNEAKHAYIGQLSNARHLLDDGAKQRAALEVAIARLNDDLNMFKQKLDDAVWLRNSTRNKIETYLARLADSQSEMEMLRRRVRGLEEEESRIKKDNPRIEEELLRSLNNLDQETINRLDYQNQAQSLMEEIDFLRRVHDEEVRELQALASRDQMGENREYFKNELALAIRDIRHEYDTISQQGKSDMESWYKLKVQEIQSAGNKQIGDVTYQREETTRLRHALGDTRNKLMDLESKNSVLEKQVQELMYQLEDDQKQYEYALGDRMTQIRKMQEESQALMMELQLLLDTKQSLDAEIAIYRKILETEENRQGLRDLVTQAVKAGSGQTFPERPPRPTSQVTTGPTEHEQPEREIIVQEGTLKPYPAFNPAADAEVLQKAMKGLGTDEESIARVLGTRSVEQRQDIIREYKAKFNKDLVADLKSELSGDFWNIIEALCMTPPDFDASTLHKNLEKHGTDKDPVIEIICTRSTRHLHLDQEAYRRLFNRNLVDDVQNAKHGHCQRLLAAMLRSNREDTDIFYRSLAAKDAQILRDTAAGKWGTEGSPLNTLLATRTYPQLRADFREFERLVGKPIEEVVKTEAPKELQAPLASIVLSIKNKPVYFAAQLHKTMKGLGTDELALDRVVVTRCEVDMVQIKEDFKRQADKRPLAQWIEDDTSGDYKKILLSLIGEFDHTKHHA